MNSQSILAFIFSMGFLFQSHSLYAKSRVIGDGSSTVFPISEAMAEEFQKANPGVQVAVAVSGTGGGFKKFCKGEIDFTGASRPIEEAELKACAASQVDFVELPMGYDGITVVVNPNNTWATSLTIAELKKIWESGSSLKNWKEVRAGFPDVKLSLYGPGHDSGTFDYFTKVINGKEKSSRVDFMASEDDNTLVKGVSGDKGGLGYFGYAYYLPNQKALKVLGVDAGRGAVLPSTKTIHDGTYAPLSRPIFVYFSKKALERTEVKSFANYYLSQASILIPEVGYVPLGESLYAAVKARLDKSVLGTMYTSEADTKLSLKDLLQKKTSPQAKKN